MGVRAAKRAEQREVRVLIEEEGRPEAFLDERDLAVIAAHEESSEE